MMRPILLATLYAAACAVNAQPMAELSAKFTAEERISPYIGRDGSSYYALRLDGLPGRQQAFIDVRDKTTFVKERSFPVLVPAESAQELRLEEFVVNETTLYMFYSFYLRKEDQIVLAVAQLDKTTGEASGAIKLMSLPSSTRGTAGRFYIKHHEHSGSTTIVYTRPSIIGVEPGYAVVPEFQVMVLDEQLNMVHRGEGKMSDDPYNYVHFDRALLAESGDVYLLASLRKENSPHNGFFLVSYDHRTGQTLKTEVPAVSNKKEWSWSTDDVMFREDPKGEVFCFLPMAPGFSGMGVATFDKETCAFGRWQESLIHTKDIGDASASRQPPRLNAMMQTADWFSDDGRFVFGLQRGSNSEFPGHGMFALLTWDPVGGLSDVHFLQHLSTTTNYAESGQGSVAFLKDPKASDGAVVVFQEIPANVGLSGGAVPRRWDTGMTKKTGLTPVCSLFDGVSFSPRTSLLDQNLIPPARMQLWASFPDEGLYIFTMSTKEDLRFMTVKP